MLVSVGSGLYINHLEEQLNNVKIDTAQTVEIIKHDTIYVTSTDTIQLVKYVDRPIFIAKEDSTYLDSLYTNFKNLALAGEPVSVADEVWFNQDFLKTIYEYPSTDQSLGKFNYTFLPAPDTVITNTITKTKIVDKTPPLQMYFGARLYKYSDGLQQDFGGTVGLKLKNISAELTYMDNRDKIFGVNYYIPVKFPKISLW